MSEGMARKAKRVGAKTQADHSLTFTVAAESWRFRAYVAFWFMCGFAIVISKLVVADILAAGPEDGSTCGPYNRDNADFGVHPGKGFDYYTQTHLQELFGFGNICTNWDYSPSRELTAMVYPLFEYSLLIYLCLDFCATSISYKRGELTEGFWKFSKVVFPLCLFLCAEFRMIFVNIAYENVQGHTAGFLGLQVALILVAIQNTGFIYDAQIGYAKLGGLKNTRALALAYIIGDLIICSFKITATIYVVQNGRGADWTLKPSPFPGKCVGQVVDLIWMVFNAVIPLCISYFRSKNEFPLKITITQGAIYLDGSSAEMAPLQGGGAGSHSKYESARLDEVF